MASQIHLDSRNKLFIWGANPPFIVVKLQMILGNENISIEQERFTSQIEKTCKNSVKLQDNRPRGPVSKDEFNAKFEKHIAENVAKGSALCPLGSTFINDSNKEKLADDLDLNGFDPNAPDSDDEPLSDLEM